VVVGVLAVGGTVALAGAVVVAAEEELAVLVVVVAGCTPDGAGSGKVGVELV
jgi:hypothetical protein